MHFTSVECFVHSRALFVCDVELLVGDEELGSDVLAAVDLLLGVSALACEGEPVLVGKVKHALQRRPAVDGGVVLAEQGRQLLFLVQPLAYVL